MRQTIALFLDAYRDLNARKLFWVTLVISAVIVSCLAVLGVENDTLTFFGWRWDREDGSFFYRYVVLSTFVMGIWLSWGAVILALVSTGGVFPDLIVSGAIDLYLSKPISRLRLFLTRYIAGLMFVTIQLVVFCTGCFFVVGLRAHDWRPSLFLAIPYVTLLFSYVYGFCVLLGVVTRSSISALLLTIVLWLAFSFIARVDIWTSMLHKGMDLTIERATTDIHWLKEREIPQVEREKRLLDLRPGILRKRVQLDEDRIAEVTSNLKTVRKIHRALGFVHTILPKTFETNNLLDRRLIKDDEIPEAASSGGAPPVMGVNMKELQVASHDVQMAARQESPIYIIGSSLLCEAVIVSFAAWIFCRRDY